MNVFILFILLISVSLSQAGVPFITKVTDKNGKSLVRYGTLYGLDKPPVDAKYTMIIENHDRYKEDSFATLNCITSLSKDIHETKDTTLETIYYSKTGLASIATGHIKNTTIYPKQDYKLIIVNSKYVGEWDLLTCSIE